MRKRLKALEAKVAQSGARAHRSAGRRVREGDGRRFHKTMLNEFYREMFRKKISRTLEDLQAALDRWIEDYNAQRPPQGR
jgi:transposase InsO family protein